MSKNAGNIVLEAKNVVYYYKANKGKKVLDDISYGFEIGKMYAILGPSGSGKTTFLSLLAGLDSPTDGGIYYEKLKKKKKKKKKDYTTIERKICHWFFRIII